MMCQYMTHFIYFIYLFYTTHFKGLVACCSIMFQMRDCHKLVACRQGSAHTGFNWLTEQVLLVSSCWYCSLVS